MTIFLLFVGLLTTQCLKEDEITNKIEFSHNPFSMPQGDLTDKDLENPSRYIGLSV